MPATTMMTRARCSRGMLAQQPMKAGDADVVEPVDVLPMSSAVTAASSATGRSEVPAHATSNGAVPGGHVALRRA